MFLCRNVVILSVSRAANLVFPALPTALRASKKKKQKTQKKAEKNKN